MDDVWTTKTLKFQDAVKKLGLPRMLRVTDPKGSSDPIVVKVCRKVISQSVVVRTQSSQQVLLPLGYEGQVTILTPSKAAKQYFDVKKVIKDKPNFLKVEEDLITMTKGSHSNIFVSKGTVLQYDKVLDKTNGHGKVVGQTLLCLDGTKVIPFAVNCKVHFTALPEQAFYTLREVVDKFKLPQTIQFEYVDPNDIVDQDDDNASQLLEMLSRPIEISTFLQRWVYVGQLKPAGSSSAYSRLIVIPKKNVYNVQVTKPDMPGMEDKMMRQFPTVDLREVEVKLYLQHFRDSQYTTLQYKCKTETSVEDNFDQPPPIPPRPGEPDVLPPRPGKPHALPPEPGESQAGSQKPHEPHSISARQDPSNTDAEFERKEENDSVESFITIVNRRSKSGFDKVHTELHVKWKHDRKRVPSEIRSKSIRIKAEIGVHEYDYVTMSPSDFQPIIGEETEKILPPPIPPRPCLKKCQSEPKLCTANSGLPEAVTISEETEGGDSDITNDGNRRLSPPVPVNSQNVSPLLQSNTVTVHPHDISQTTTDRDDYLLPIEKRTLQRPPIPSTDSMSFTDTIADVLGPHIAVRQVSTSVEKEKTQHVAKTKTELLFEHSSTSSESIPLRELQRAVNPLSTFSVEQLAQCFRDCALGELATACENELIDGGFFMELTVENLKEAPFNLSSFHITKLRKILSGWRPKAAS